jgi:hypothetical protein
MTPGGTERRIRIRVGGDDARDLRALHSWLGLEDWFAQAEAANTLAVVYREGDGTEREAHRDGPPMSGGVIELVLVIAGAALSPVFEDLYGRAKVAVRAWADNVSSEQHPIDTEVEIESGDTDAPVPAPAGPDVPAGATGSGAAGRAQDGEDERTR